MNDQQNNPSGEAFEPEVQDLYPEEGSTIFVKQERKDKTPPRNNGSRRRAISLLAMVLCLAVVAAAIYAVARFLPQEEPAESTSSSLGKLGFTLVQVDMDKVDKIHLKNQETDFTVFAKADTASDPTDRIWVVEDIDPTLTSSSEIFSFVSNCTDIEALRQMSGTTGEFGFDNPTAVITVTCNDSSLNYTLTIGKPSADSVGYYAKLTDEAVYIIDGSYISPLLVEATDFANTKIYSAVSTSTNAGYYSDGQLINLDYIALSGKNFKNPIRIEMNPDDNLSLSYLVTQPVKRPAKDDAVRDLLSLFAESLSGSGMYAYSLTPALKAQYGLDTPLAVLEVKIGDFEVKLSVGNLQDEYYAVMRDGVNAIYKVAADAIPFVYSTDSSFNHTRFYYENLDQVETLTISGGGKNFAFATQVDEENNLTVTHEGVNKNDTIFKVFYRNVLAMGIQNFDATDVAGETVLTIKTTFHDNKAASTLTFTDAGNRMCLVKSEGKVLGSMPKTQVTAILDYAERVVNGQTVPEPAIG